MSLASAARVGVSYVAENTQGTTPGSPTMKTLRNTSRGLNPRKNLLESNEGRSDRQIADVRHGFNFVDGTIGTELGMSSYDDMLEGGLSGTWGAVTVAGTPTFGATAPNIFTRSAGSFTADGFRVGDIIKTVSYAASNNNGTWTVSAVGTTTITVIASTVTTVAVGAGPALTYPGKRLDIGTTLRTFTFEKRFPDIGIYEVSRGNAVDQLTINMTPEQLVTLMIAFRGLSFGAQSGTSLGSPTAAPTYSPFASFDGAFILGGVENAITTQLEMNLNNNRASQGVIGSRYAPQIFEGDARVSGSFSAFFEDESQFNAFYNETETACAVRLDDVGGTEFMGIVIPRLKINTNEKDPPRNGPVISNQAFIGLVHQTYGTTLSIQRSIA